MPRKEYHVVPHENGWAVKKNNASKSSACTSTKSDAVSKAKELSKNSGSEMVVHGKKLGRKIGIPTINQNIKSKNLILKSGIYSTICTIDNQTYYGVTNVGTRPTVDNNGCKNIETYIIDFDDDCYNKNVKLEFVYRIRDEIKFESIDELKSQIQQDILTTKRFFYTN